MLELKLPLPPTTNHGYQLTGRSGKARMVKTDELKQWELVVAFRMADKFHLIPEKQSLAVIIILCFPAKQMRRVDLDGPVKFLIDAVVGARADQWVDHLSVSKCKSSEPYGFATIRVFPTEVLGP